MTLSSNNNSINKPRAMTEISKTKTKSRSRTNGVHVDLNEESSWTEDDDEDDRFFLVTPHRSICGVTGTGINININNTTTPMSKTFGGQQSDIVENFFIFDVSGPPSLCSSVNASPRRSMKQVSICSPIREGQLFSHINNNNDKYKKQHRYRDRGKIAPSPRHNIHQASISTNMSHENEHSLKDFIVYPRHGGPCVTKRIYGPSAAQKSGINNNDDNNDNNNEESYDSRRNSISADSSFDSSKTFVMNGILGQKEYKAYKQNQQ